MDKYTITCSQTNIDNYHLGENIKSLKKTTTEVVEDVTFDELSAYFLTYFDVFLDDNNLPISPSVDDVNSRLSKFIGNDINFIQNMTEMYKTAYDRYVLVIDLVKNDKFDSNGRVSVDVSENEHIDIMKI